MNKLIVAISMFVLTTFCALAQPKLTIIGGDEYNWGDVKPADSPLKAAIQLKNEGTEVLEIKSVKTSCGCTTAPLDKDKLAPGETTTMNVEFKVSANTGVTSKNISFETNDPQRKKVFYKISANIVRDLVCKPSNYMPFKDLKVGIESSSTIFMKNNSKKDITFSELKVEPAGVKLTIPETFTLKPNEEIEITGRLTRNEKGYFNSKIKMKTNHPDYPTFEIPAYGSAAESAIFNDTKSKAKAEGAAKSQTK
jgi:hypothetical protein